MAEEQHSLMTWQRAEENADLVEMFAPDLFPLRQFLRERFGLVHWQRDERRGDTYEQILASLTRPKRFYSEIALQPREAVQPQPALISPQRLFSDFMIAHHCFKTGAEGPPK